MENNLSKTQKETILKVKRKKTENSEAKTKLLDKALSFPPPTTKTHPKMPDNESPWLSTETVDLDDAALAVKSGFRNVLTKFLEFVLRDSVLEVTLGLMYVL